MKKKKSTLLIVSMSFLLSIGTLIFSSCADKDDPSPILPTPEDTSYILKLKFSEKVEFKEILNKNDIQDLTETETAYFGERIQWSCPHELQFDRDSLSIVKTNNIVEKYKLKWQDKKSSRSSAFSFSSSSILFNASSSVTVFSITLSSVHVMVVSKTVLVKHFCNNIT